VTSAIPPRRHREVRSLRLPSNPSTAPNTLRGSASAPLASVRRLSSLAAQRPRNSSVPPVGQSKRADRQRALDRASSSGGVEITATLCRCQAQRIVQFENGSAGGPPSGISCSCSVCSPILRRPCRRPIKAGEVGNKDARKHRGLLVPVIAYLSQLPPARSSLACLRFGQQLGGTVRGVLTSAADCGRAGVGSPG